MAGASNSIFYDQVIRITHVYLGPAADRYITRQIQNHLHKTPDELTREDLLQLIAWIQLTVSLLTEDNEVVEEYIAQLQHLASPDNKAKR